MGNTQLEKYKKIILVESMAIEKKWRSRTENTLSIFLKHGTEVTVYDLTGYLPNGDLEY